MNRLRIVPIIAVLLSAVLAGSVFAAGAEEGAIALRAQGRGEGVPDAVRMA